MSRKARSSGLFRFGGEPASRVLTRGRVSTWSKEQMSALSTLELRQLLANAERLSEDGVATLCNELLGERPRGHVVARRPRPKGAAGRLVARGKAFEMQGVRLQSRAWSRSAVRETDGTVVISVWAGDVRQDKGINSCLLWAPNVDGSRPWSDKPGGLERLEHCRQALAQGSAQGLLVYGEAAEGWLPEEKTQSVEGVDAENVLDLRIEKRGEEYWASWNEVRRVPARVAR
jgi:hypothetical protein